ncbi:uncharacterized protein LOC131951319 [Physella acuta]|uniref:uncharacterized protein LOC131951319 n=1 Tax=Physella acuta TaxID=109671 RepID=UPI0027DE026E|nr:uncharacterized protein LOC131951319 [Physella acuta]
MDTHPPIIERATLVLNTDVDMALCKRVTDMKFKIVEVEPRLVVEKEHVSYNDILSIAKLLKDRFQSSDNARSVVSESRDTSSDRRSIVSHGRDTSSDRRSIVSHGRDTSSDRRSIVSHGRDTSSDRRSIVSHGRDTSSDRRSIVLHGRDTSSDRRSIVSHGRDASSDRRSVVSQRRDTSTQPCLLSLAEASMLNSDVDNHSRPSGIKGTLDFHDVTSFIDKSRDEFGIHKNTNRTSGNSIQNKTQEKRIRTSTGHENSLVSVNKQQSPTGVAGGIESLHDNTPICHSEEHQSGTHNDPGNNSKTNSDLETSVAVGTSNTDCFSDPDNEPEEQRILALNPGTSTVVSEGASDEVDEDRDKIPTGRDAFVGGVEKRQASLDTHSRSSRGEMKHTGPGAGRSKGFGYSEEQGAQTHTLDTIHSNGLHDSESDDNGEHTLDTIHSNGLHDSESDDNGEHTLDTIHSNGLHDSESDDNGEHTLDTIHSNGLHDSESDDNGEHTLDTIHSNGLHDSESDDNGDENLPPEQNGDHRGFVSDNTTEEENGGEITKATFRKEVVEPYNTLSDEEGTKSSTLAGMKETETDGEHTDKTKVLEENWDVTRDKANCTMVKDKKDNIQDNKTIARLEANNVGGEVDIEGNTTQQNLTERLPETSQQNLTEKLPETSQQNLTEILTDSDDDSSSDGDSTDLEEKTIVLKKDEFNAAKYYFKNTEFSSRLTSQAVDLNLKEKTDAELAEKLARFKVIRVPVTGLSQGDLEEMLEEFVRSPSDKVKVKVFVNDVVLMGPAEKVLEAKRKILSKCEFPDKTSDSQQMGTSNIEPSATRLVKHAADDRHFFSLDNSNTAEHGSRQGDPYGSLQVFHEHAIAGHSLSDFQSSRSFRDQPKVYMGHNNPSLSVYVANADITQMSVDVIVSAANTKLKHHGGVAKAIAAAAGPDMTQECDTFIGQHGQLDVTDVFVSGAGRLQVSKVIHAVAPVYKMYVDKVKCVTDLRQTVLRCLVEASRLGMSSIALPSVSAAVFKTHEEKCAQCYMEAVKHYDYFIHELNLQPVKKVQFVDVDTNMVNTTQEYFLKHWHQPPDRRLVQMDLEFSRKHLKKVSKSVTSQGANGFKNVEFIVGDISLVVTTDPALSLSSEMTVVFGDVFDALSNRPGFKAKEQVRDVKHLPKIKDRLKFVKLNRPGGSEMGTLCVVSPQPQSLRDIDVCFENLKLATDQFNSAGIRSLTFTSKLFYLEKTLIKQSLLERFVHLVVEFVEEMDFDHDSSLKTALVAANEMTATSLTKEFDSHRIERKVDRGLQDYLPQDEAGYLDELLNSSGNLLSATFPESLGGIQGACGGDSPPRAWYLSSLYDHLSRLVGTSSSEKNRKDKDREEKKIPPVKNGQKNEKDEQEKELKDSAGLDNACVICYEKDTSIILPCCKARICSSCKTKVQLCPFCRKSLEILTGVQPDGNMDVDLCEGDKYWKITYRFPPGFQKAHHPHPGKLYIGTTRTAYIPSTEEGFETLLLLRLAFKRRLTFTIGKSLMMNKDDMITWNDIHHKTSPVAGTYGYPDPTYLERVNQELSNKGVTTDSMSADERQDIDTFSNSLKTNQRFTDSV